MTEVEQQLGYDLETEKVRERRGKDKERGGETKRGGKERDK